MVDYTNMPATEMLFALGDDGARWAEAFCQHAKKLGYSDMDEGWVIGWFANAIEQSTVVRNRKAPTVIKDFPGRSVDRFLKTHGRLPGEATPKGDGETEGGERA